VPGLIFLAINNEDGTNGKKERKKEKCRLRVFDNMVLIRIFGPKRDEVTGEWRRLHNKELYAL
jgi:hypothetical protein